MTIEDPVEYVFPSINQIQINEQAGVTFAGGLRSILRQDPDVILVGEIRDVETARIAVQSALTGHFVLSSLHATDAAVGAAPVPRHGHRAVPRRLVGHRRRRPAPRAPHLRPLPASRTSRPPRSWRSTASAGGARPRTASAHGEGCNFCAQHRLPRPDRRLRAAAHDRRRCGSWSSTGPDHEEIRELAIAEGMRTLREEAVRLVEDGVTTIAEVVRSIYIL